MVSVAKSDFDTAFWIFGHNDFHLNPFIWICNFVIYKSHILACEGQRPDMLQQCYMEYVRFQLLFSVLANVNFELFLQDTSDDGDYKDSGLP